MAVAGRAVVLLTSVILIVHGTVVIVPVLYNPNYQLMRTLSLNPNFDISILTITITITLIFYFLSLFRAILYIY
jgi:hypothetical protein